MYDKRSRLYCETNISLFFISAKFLLIKNLCYASKTEYNMILIELTVGPNAIEFTFVIYKVTLSFSLIHKRKQEKEKILYCTSLCFFFYRAHLRPRYTVIVYAYNGNVNSVNKSV